MIDAIERIMTGLPVLHDDKSPDLAAFLAFLGGGIALGIYFRSMIDFFIPVAIAVALSVVFGDAGFFGGALVACLYGFFRAQDSNQRRGVAAAPAPLGSPIT